MDASGLPSTPALDAGVTRREVRPLPPERGASSRTDLLAVEEPLEIRLDGEPVAITMRTPGDDARLALGFLFAEGIIRGLEELGAIAHCGRPGEQGWGNVLDVRAAAGARLEPERVLERRHFVVSSACGVCGRGTIDDLLRRLVPVEGPASLPVAVVTGAVARLSVSQPRFSRTGGLHAAAAFDARGELLCCFEDVGRHNAVDKVVGALLQRGLVPASAPAARLLVVSGRASFEIVQKAAAALIPAVASVSAPSSLAVDVADAFGIGLAGFVRGARLNVYSHPERFAET